MKSYITQAGLALLQTALATLPNPPTVQFTGSQAGSTSGFVPNETMLTAQGTMLADRRTDASSVKITKLMLHEAIYTVILGRDLEFTAVGNVLFFLNDTPAFWLISDQPFGTLAVNPITHFAGDKCYLPLVLRFPYLEKLIAFNSANSLHAVFPKFDTMKDLTIPEHTRADQCFIEQNTLYYGRNYPVVAARIDDIWASTPLMQPIGPDFFRIDGGQTKTGF